MTHSPSPLLKSPPGSAAPLGSCLPAPGPRFLSLSRPSSPYLWPLLPGNFPPWGRGCGRPEVRRWQAGSAATRPSAAPPRRASDSASVAVEEHPLGGRRVPTQCGVAAEEPRPALEDGRGEALCHRGCSPPARARKRPCSSAAQAARMCRLPKLAARSCPNTLAVGGGRSTRAQLGIS